MQLAQIAGRLRNDSPSPIRRNGILNHWWLSGLICVLFCAAAAGQEKNGPAREEFDLQDWLKQTQEALAKVDNYTAVFRRVEWVDGKLIPEEVTFLKFKRPFKVYMKWVSPHKGQESLYVRGANGDKVRAHSGGLLGVATVNLDPKGSLAMKNSRHPITEAGLQNLVERIAANVRQARGAGELVSKDLGEKTVYGRKTRELEGILPKDAAKGYYCYRCVVNVDLETKMPIMTRIFDWENRLVESYGYEKLKLNPGLTDKDFDPKNPEYSF